MLLIPRTDREHSQARNHEPILETIEDVYPYIPEGTQLYEKLQLQLSAEKLDQGKEKTPQPNQQESSQRHIPSISELQQANEYYVKHCNDLRQQIPEIRAQLIKYIDSLILYLYFRYKKGKSCPQLLCEKCCKINHGAGEVHHPVCKQCSFGHIPNACPFERFCYYCYGEGHRTYECEELLAKRVILCRYCNGRGHSLKSCPNWNKEIEKSLMQQKKPYIMYHGTDDESAQKILNERFRPSTDGMLGSGVYFSNSLRKALAYGDCVLMCYVELMIDGVIDIDIDDIPYTKIILTHIWGREGQIQIFIVPHPMQKTWAEAGYQAAYVPPGVNPSGLPETCVKNPTLINVIKQIK